MNNFSLILIARNEEKNLKEWGSWIKKFRKLNELIVVDDESTDKSITTAKKLATKKLAVKVFRRPLNQDFALQRQYACDQAVNDWILWLDADEHPSPELIGYINHIDTTRYFNYAFRRADIFLGRTLHHGETATQYFLRFFNKKYGYFSGMVHELWVSSKPTVRLDVEIIHQSHPHLKSFFEKINVYSDIRARELFKNHTKVSLGQIVFYPLGKFLQNYIFRLGFLDGTPGIILALGMSFHSFLVRAKLWTYYNP